MFFITYSLCFIFRND